MTAASVDCDGVIETVLSGGKTTDALSAKLAAEEIGDRVGVTAKGRTACMMASEVSLIRAD